MTCGWCHDKDYTIVLYLAQCSCRDLLALCNKSGGNDQALVALANDKAVHHHSIYGSLAKYLDVRAVLWYKVHLTLRNQAKGHDFSL